MELDRLTATYVPDWKATLNDSLVCYDSLWALNDSHYQPTNMKIVDKDKTLGSIRNSIRNSVSDDII